MQFTLTSEEGLPIRGDLELKKEAQALVVVVHGFKGFKDWGFFPWLSEYLAAQRIAVCRFNMSRSGIGENPDSFDRLDLFADDTYSTQIGDLRTVVRHCHSRADVPIFLLGHSRGGGIALLSASLVPNLCGVITWSAIARTDRWDEPTRKQWRKDGFYEVENARTKQVMRMSTRILDDCEANRERFDILAAAKRLDVPILVIHGGRDESVPVEEGRLIASRAKDPALVVLHRASHTFNAIHPLVHVPFELVLASEVSAHFVISEATRRK